MASYYYPGDYYQEMGPPPLTSYYPMDYYQDMGRPAIKDCYQCISQITENLFLTGAEGASNYYALRHLGITNMISATFPENFPTPNYPNIDFERKEIPDSQSADIYKYFDKVADRIDNLERMGGRVLVHCYAGMSRGPTLVLAYLMKYRGMKLNEAYALVIKQRPVIRPNCGFWRQLMRYERRLYGRVSVVVGNC